MSGHLSAQETSALAVRIKAWKRKHKKSWDQVAQDLSVSRNTLYRICLGRSPRTSTVVALCDKLRWSSFRRIPTAKALWGAEELQIAAASARPSTQPLLWLQVLHAAASLLHLTLAQRGVVTKLSLPDAANENSHSWVSLNDAEGFPVLDVQFHIRCRRLGYSMHVFSRERGSEVVGEGYAGTEGLSFCEEFFVTQGADSSKVSGEALRNKVIKVFNAYQLHGRSRK